MLKIVTDLFNSFNTNTIKYCHWKSNARLSESLDGSTDIDILVRREHIHKAVGVLLDLKFKQSVITNGVTFPSMQHYYGLDENTSKIVHVHIYYSIITGESLLKNYQLPFDDMIFDNLRTIDGICVPRKSVELVIFTLRMMLKHAVMVEHAMVWREYDEVIEELDWLSQGNAKTNAIHLVKKYLPSLSESLFALCLVSLHRKDAFLRRYVLGNIVRCALNHYSRYSWPFSDILNNYRFLKMVWLKLVTKQKNQVLASGGAIIAFVGPEATGKSTLASEVTKWLKPYYPVYNMHIGKPNTPWYGILPKLSLPILRRLLPKHRSTYIEANNNSDPVLSLLYMFRCVWLAHDRTKILLRAKRMSLADSAIIVCDRYPSSRKGAVDSSQLSPELFSKSLLSVRTFLAHIENRFYHKVPPPDIVFQLTVPVEVAVSRNSSRIKSGTETDEFVRYRHSTKVDFSYKGSHVFIIDTSETQDQTIRRIKNEIWNHL